MFVLVLFFSSVSFPPPGDLPYPGIKLTPLVYPALAGSFFTTGAPGKPLSSDNLSFTGGSHLSAWVWRLFYPLTACCCHLLPYMFKWFATHTCKTHILLLILYSSWSGNLFQLCFWYLRGGKNSDFAYCYKAFFFSAHPRGKKTT